MTLRTLALLVLVAATARADTVVLKKGKKLEGVVVSRHDGSVVVINPFRSRHPEMTWEIPDKNRIPADKVKDVIIADDPLVEYRRRASKPGLGAVEHTELAAFCEQHKLKAQRIRHLRLALCANPGLEEVRKSLGDSKWRSWSKGNPVADPDLRRLERNYVESDDDAELPGLWGEMRAKGTTRKLEYLERARRSQLQPRRRRDKVPLTLGGRQVAGATYCLYVPEKYDPLHPTALVIALHGGGPGGKDRTLVTGSGESAMNFYMDVAEKWGWIVAAPTAKAAPWGAKENSALLDALLDEMRMLYNVDENRIYLTGHSMGGFGTWYWGPRKSDVWAACAPCAGGGGPNGVSSKGLPVYIFHGSDDGIVGPSSDRSAAKALLGDKKADFVYTELDKVGHGFPRWVREDIFRFFAGRWKAVRRKPAIEFRSSFDRKVSKDEIKAFGDPGKLPTGPEEDAGLKTQVKALAAGGGGAAEAADELGKRKGDVTAAKAVAKVLRSKKTPVDGRALAARVLGSIAVPESVKALTKALNAEDYRVVEAATWALGETKLPEAAPALVRAARRLGEFYDQSFFGDVINFTEYKVRLESFGVLVEAFRKVGDGGSAGEALDKEVIGRVYLPRKDYRVAGANDPRFRHVPPNSRLALLRALRECFVAFKLGDAASRMEAIAERWEKRQPSLASEARAAAEELKST